MGKGEEKNWGNKENLGGRMERWGKKWGIWGKERRNLGERKEFRKKRKWGGNKGENEK